MLSSSFKWIKKAYSSLVKSIIAKFVDLKRKNYVNVMEHFPLYVLCLSYIEGQVWNMTIYAFREEKSLMMYSEVSLIVRSSKIGYCWAKE
jgi:hypothetical protein